MNKHNKEGFSLLELLLVLGIVSALIISAFIIYPKVQTMYRVDRISKTIVGVKSSIKQLYQGQAYYDKGVANTNLRNTVFPENTYTHKNNGLPLNDYGGTYSIQGQYSMHSGLYQGFSIDLTDVPSADCQRIISNVYASFEIVAVDASIVFKVPFMFDDNAVEFDRSTVAAACNKSSTVTMQFYTF
ncbi:TPA: prepilin-type N-terminal cleavage/methylation domain-containing protein [Escherichia coli]|uniref:type 4 pilus major pilin n=1 Tax=Escherichia coli TaxID=562 RepID=UPI000F86070F|nr:type 4 pilus major pilin [Escherichia coli]HBX7614377.1 prepilin-type N-terminal cleavage/methylation domain-containing protein [Klebsiella pneumoniae]EHW2964808.1 prepilin-type N-terminal cleavage/methylation domain-containing protein [Escherichia coli]EJF8622944.1 prepilin-type N-terminal cleavage/methylation domain-containing protein [Escherichia coli]ELG2545796.1 prepilin-type N-terminal cleavage/methylation domain-containing protein [Escherichia coli]MBP0514456.1 prepilin-type N-termin